MEHFGTGPNTVHGTLHGPGYSGPGGLGASYTVGSSLGHDFHVYSVAWQSGSIRWYVNDDLYHGVAPADLDGKPGFLTKTSTCLSTLPSAVPHPSRPMSQ